MSRLRFSVPVFFSLAFVTLLVGCAHADRELPENNAPGSDKMKKSPCACEQLPYQPRSYKWLG